MTATQTAFWISSEPDSKEEPLRIRAPMMTWKSACPPPASSNDTSWALPCCFEKALAQARGSSECTTHDKASHAVQGPNVVHLGRMRKAKSTTMPSRHKELPGLDGRTSWSKMFPAFSEIYSFGICAPLVSSLGSDIQKQNPGKDRCRFWRHIAFTRKDLEKDGVAGNENTSSHDNKSNID